LNQHPYSEDVHFVELDDRQIILVGTAHVSRKSVELVKEVITQEKPDCVCVELDAQRYTALKEEKRWESLNLKDVIRNKQLSTLMVNLILSSYQKKLGGQLGVLPGSELLEAARTAEAMNIPLSLCDRDVRITLKRAWRLTPFFKKMHLLASLMASMFDKTELSEEKLGEIRQHDVLNEMMAELGQSLPTLKQVLIDERDAYLAQKIKDSEGKKVVAVVGAGHVAGMKKALAHHEMIDLRAISSVPPPQQWTRIIAWGVPILILSTLLLIGIASGIQEAGENALFWVLVNGIPSAIGAILALAHPATVIISFLASPITSLTPIIGVGTVTALVQAYYAPPTMKEFQQVGEDMHSLKMWWKNRLLKIFLAFLLPSLGSVIGTFYGASVLVERATKAFAELYLSVTNYITTAGLYFILGFLVFASLLAWRRFRH
jgi:pheromone shutdown-related protein TraB